MLILVGPSASGKTQVAQMLIQKYNMEKMVTYTTRPMREKEVDGVDYHFISRDEFEKKIKDNFFLEHVTYNNNFYGTAFASISDNKVVILEPSGLKTYLDKLPNDVFIIYLRCSEEVLRIRMKIRGNNDDEIKKRLELDKGVFNSSVRSLAHYTIDTTASNTPDVTEKVYKLYQKSLKK